MEPRTQGESQHPISRLDMLIFHKRSISTDSVHKSHQQAREQHVTRIRFWLLFSLLIPAIIQIPHRTFAQPMASACPILASRLTPDLSTQTSFDQRINITKEMISSQQYSNWDTASKDTVAFGISVVKYVDLSLKTTSDKDSWAKNWSEFKRMNVVDAESTAQIYTYNQKWNPALITAFLTGCPPSGFYAQLTNVARDFDSFNVQVHGNGSFSIDGLTFNYPQTTSCQGYRSVTPSTPKTVVNDTILTCTKDPNQAITMVISSNQSVAQITVDSIQESLRKKYEELQGQRERHY